MAKPRDWAKDVAGTEITFLYKEGDHIFCGKEGFTFKVHRANWPPKRLSPEVCTDPVEYYKYQVRGLHGDTYDLSPTVYSSADGDVEAICSKHGKFTIQAKYFKSRRGCQLCGYESAGRSAALTTQEFIDKATDIHGDKYDYRKVEYVRATDPVSIVCTKHGEFSQVPYNHLAGKGCVECGWEISRLSRVLHADDVLQRFNSVHGDRYDYSLVEYNGDSHDLLKISCDEHGTFLQSYANHFHNKQGCPVCAKEFSPRLRSGFIRSSESKGGYASLYLINCFDEFENFFKIGITTKPLNRRFAGSEAMPYQYNCKHLLIGDAEFIWDLENTLHAEYRDTKYIPQKEFGGRYECFSNIDIGEYSKLLQYIC